MEENLKNKLGFWTFVFIVLFLAIGGYFFTNYVLNDNQNKNKIEEKKKDYRINKDEDYIYFTNVETISEGAEIYYQDVIINLTTQETLNESLKKENENYKNGVKYLTDEDVSIISEDLIHYRNDNIYSITYREYATYKYNNYVTLLINDYNYSCFDATTFSKTKSYVFDVNTGKLINEETLLDMYETNINIIKEKIREYLNSKQQIVDGLEYINIEDTINELNNYSLYISDSGKLYISYLVKTTKDDYNEIMEV